MNFQPNIIWAAWKCIKQYHQSSQPRESGVFNSQEENDMSDKSKWFVYNPDGKNEVGCFRIAPLSTNSIVNSFAELSAKRAEKKLDDIDYVKEYIKIIASTVILDWENVSFSDSDSDCEETPYTPENAFNLLFNGKSGTVIAAWIMDQAKSLA